MARDLERSIRALLRPGRETGLGPARPRAPIPAALGVAEWGVALFSVRALQVVLEHGLLAPDGRVRVGGELAAAYPGEGWTQPRPATGALYGQSDSGPCWAWDGVTAPESDAATLAPTAAVVAFNADRERLPSLHTGLARHLAQVWGPHRSLTAGEWTAGRLQAWRPQRCGLIRDVDTSDTTPVLSYWAVYAGGVGGSGAVGEVGADTVSAIRCTIAAEAQCWADAVTSDGSLTDGERAWCEAVVLASLRIDATAEAVVLLESVGAVSGDAWSFRAHGWQWQPVALGDLSVTQWEARTIQYRRVAGSAVQQQRLPVLQIIFAGAGETRAPTATCTGLGVAESLCWDWSEAALWVPPADGVSEHVRVDLRNGLHNWGIAVDGPGTLWGCWTATGTWQSWTYDGATRTSGARLLLGDRATDGGSDYIRKLACGSPPDYHGEVVENYTNLAYVFAGIGCQTVSGTYRHEWAGTAALQDSYSTYDVSIWSNNGYYETLVEEGCTYQRDTPVAERCEYQKFGGQGCSWINGTEKCSGPSPTASQYAWSQERYTLTLEESEYGPATYRGDWAGLVIGADDPAVVHIVRSRQRQSGARTTYGEASRSNISGRLSELAIVYKYDLYWPPQWWQMIEWRYTHLDDVVVQCGWGAWSSTIGQCGNALQSAQFGATLSSSPAASDATYDGTIATYVAGDLLAEQTVAVAGGGDIFDGEPISWEHLRMRCRYVPALDGDDPPPLTMPGGHGSGGGLRLYQRWTGDQSQGSSGYSGVSLAGRWLGCV